MTPDDVRAMIEECLTRGDAALNIRDDITYTIGLWKRFQHPELVLLGVPERNGLFLNQFIHRICHRGQRFSAGEVHSGFFTNGYRVALEAVPDEHRIRLVAAAQYYGEPPPALQVLWPDLRGRLPAPYDSGCEVDVQLLQAWTQVN